MELGGGALARDGVPNVRWCERCGGVFADVESSRRVISAIDRTLSEIAFEAALGKALRPDDGRAIACPEGLVPNVPMSPGAHPTDIADMAIVSHRERGAVDCDVDRVV